MGMDTFAHGSGPHLRGARIAAQDGPFHIGTQALTLHASDALDGGAVVGRNAVELPRLDRVLARRSDQLGELLKAASLGNRLFKGFFRGVHSPNDSHIFYLCKYFYHSMNNPGGRPSYSDGDIIFVDPSREAKHGDRVIVRLDDQAEATFKQLLIEDGRKLLKALNPEWAPRYIPINGNATVCGVVIGKWVPE